LKLDGARIAIQGFGAVGRHAARFLATRGARLVAASDTGVTIADPGGLDVAALIRLKESEQPVCAYAGGKKLDRDAVIDAECDIWIPAARPDVIGENNVHRLNTKLVIQGANIPFTAAAEKILAQRGVVLVPDFIANAGGVICAAMEYAGATQGAAFAAIEEKIRANTETVLEQVKAKGVLPRDAALTLATERVRQAMGMRRFSIM